MTAPNGSREDVAWSSRWVFLMAAVGAAVGLGNIWKFPYMAGVNGGGIFVIVYIFAAVLVAIPILIAELMIGRRGRHHPAAAMETVARESGRSPRWRMVGGLGIVIVYLILSYYSVVAGWAIAYIVPTLSGAFTGRGADVISARFNELLADPWGMMIWHSLFMAATVGIVSRGLKGGIERWIGFLMPALFFALVVLLGYALVVGDVAAAARFMFHVDFGKVSGDVILAAVGQAFFSIGVGMAMMMTYGAYLSKSVSLTQSAFITAGADTLVAILAGLAVFPLVFANGLDPAEGPGLVFVTLPNAFGSMPGGSMFGGLFFVLLVVAALTSSIAALEPMVLWTMDKFSWSRTRAGVVIGVSAWVLGIGTVLSFNVWKTWHPLGMFGRFADKTFFDLLDYLTTSILTPISALLIALFAGWCLKPQIAWDELGVSDGWPARVWRRILLRWAVPAGLLGILINGL